MSINKGISVIICCYNSSSRLAETLKHIAFQVVSPAFPWELIIINNRSTDDTKEVAKREWSKYNLNVGCNIYDENNPGLKAAKEKAIEVAKYDFLVFCDDDNWLANNYIQTAYEMISSDEKIGVIGGWSEPVFEKEPPPWFDSYRIAFAIGKQAEKSGEIAGSVFGAGMVLRKSALKELSNYGFKSSLTGRKGSALSSGEDNEMCFGLRMAKYKVIYEEGLFFRHFIPATRVTWENLRKMVHGFGLQDTVLIPYSWVLKDYPDDDEKFTNWNNMAISLLSWFLKNPVQVIKTIMLKGEGDIDILTVERKFGLLKGIMKAGKNYDRQFLRLAGIMHKINKEKTECLGK